MKKTILIVSALLTAISAHAELSLPTPQIGTLGLGLQLGQYEINDNLYLRANINGLNYNKQFYNKNISYSARAHLFTAGVLADYYFKSDSGFHATTGLYYNDNHISGNGIYDGNISVNIGKKNLIINPNDYGTVGYKASYAKVAPYLGVGYHTAQTKGLSFTFDAGVLYQGRAKMSYDISSGYQNLANLSPALNSNIENSKNYLQTNADKLRFYPVLSLGVSYKF